MPDPGDVDRGRRQVANNVNLGFSDDGGLSFESAVGADRERRCGKRDGAVHLNRPGAPQGLGRRQYLLRRLQQQLQHRPDAAGRVDAAAGGAVDEACTFTVQFTAAVTDDCGVNKNDVVVKAFKQGNNFTGGPVEFMAQQTSATLVDVTGSVVVSDVSQSPAVLMLEVTGADACSITDKATTLVQVVDNTPPSIDVTLSPTSLWAPNHSMQRSWLPCR